MRKLLLVSLVLLLVFALATPVGAADGDQVYFGDTEIPVGDTVEGNVTVIWGDLAVWGTIEGDVYQYGRGFVHVDGGTVEGSVYERGRGSVQVYNGGTVTGDVVERGNNVNPEGDDRRDAIGVDVTTGGVIEGNVYEYGWGNVDVAHDDGVCGFVGGNIFEQGFGNVNVYRACEVGGNIEERQIGNVFIDAVAIVGGTICERGRGDVFIDDSAVVIPGWSSC